MRNPTPLTIPLALCSLLATPAFADPLELKIQIPQLDVAEYHRPYVAVWLEREDKSVAGNLAVWYQQKRAGGMGGAAAGTQPQAGGEGGTKWLPDLRQWWRRSGREMTMPLDGVSGATRVVGEHALTFTPGQPPLAALPAGKYKLVIEAAREEGGREVLDIPFEWPAASAQELKAQGKSELGAVTLALKPQNP